MKLLESFVRQVLNETGGAKTPEDLLAIDGSFILVEPDEESSDGIQIYYGSRQEDPSSLSPEGRVLISRVEEHPVYSRAGSAMGSYMVSMSDATKGWGPMLYDVAMEIATSIEHRGLTADRGNVSSSAKRVWDFYYNNRTEKTGGPIKYAQLDDPNNTLTPTHKDNTNQTSAKKWSGHDDWQNSSLSKVYYSSGTPVIDKLKRLGLIEFEGIGV